MEAKEYVEVKATASTCGTAVGAKQGRTKGNEQKAEYENLEGRHGNRPDRRGKQAPLEPLPGENGKKGKESAEG